MWKELCLAFHQVYGKNIYQLQYDYASFLEM